MRGLDRAYAERVPPQSIPVVQTAVAELLATGYSSGDVRRASDDALDDKAVVDCVRAYICREMRELLPLSRSSTFWPSKEHH